MARFATVDASGAPAGFYDDAAHPQIPAGAIALTPAQYAEWVYYQSARVWQGGALVPAPARPPTLDEALAALAALATAKQNGGVPFQPAASSAPILFGTDPQTRGNLLAEFVAANAGLRGGTGPWKAADGSWVTLTDDDVKALATKARAYVAACFDREQALEALVRADPATDITAGWPSNA